jgi:hypothetical protein
VKSYYVGKFNQNVPALPFSFESMKNMINNVVIGSEQGDASENDIKTVEKTTIKIM